MEDRRKLIVVSNRGPLSYYRENGLREPAHQLFEGAVSEMRAAAAPALVMGTVLYNLAAVRVQEGQRDEAIALLQEAFPLRPDMRQTAAGDSDLDELRQDPRFHRQTAGSPKVHWPETGDPIPKSAPVISRPHRRSGKTRGQAIPSSPVRAHRKCPAHPKRSG